MFRHNEGVFYGKVSKINFLFFHNFHNHISDSLNYYVINFFSVTKLQTTIILRWVDGEGGWTQILKRKVLDKGGSGRPRCFPGRKTRTF